MSYWRRGRFAGYFVAGALAGLVLTTVTEDASAGPKRARRRPAQVLRVETPLGLQGLRGAGGNVVIPFTLVDSSRRRTDIEVQWGWDQNGDDKITEDEWRAATEDRRDARNTRRNRRPTLFTTAGGIGASQAFVWNSTRDLPSGRLETVQYDHTPQGRLKPDPDNPGEFLFADGTPGVKVRVRALTGRRRRQVAGEWTVTDVQFSLNNNTRPEMTIDDVLLNDTSNPIAADEVVEILWTAIDADSEDLNGNGVEDPGESDGDPVTPMNTEPVAVAFDYYRVQPEDDPESMTDEELGALDWQPCTRAVGVGDTDTGVPSSPDGRQYTFAWDSVTDVGTVHAEFILRARPFDAKAELGEYVFVRTPVTIDNWNIFAPTPDANLPSGRVGVTVTHLPPGLDRSDYRTSNQMVLVVGGATDEDGHGSVSDVGVVLSAKEGAENSLPSRAEFGLAQLATPRSFHTATCLDDGRVLIAGGYDDNGVPLNSTEIYDPFTRTTTPGPNLLTARAKHSAVLLSSGDVAFFGGIGSGGTVLNSCERYNFTAVEDAAENPIPQVANSALPSMSAAQHSLHAVLLPDQRVLVTGGIDASGNPVRAAEAFNPLNDNDPLTPTTKDPVFESLPQMREGRAFGSATRLLNGHVLFAGGAASPSKSTMEIFNHETELFEPVDIAMPDGGRSQHVAALLGDGTVLLAGGTTDPTSGTVVPQADLIRVDGRDGGGTWSATSLPVNGDMWVPRRLAHAAPIENGRIFIAGGLDANGALVSEMEHFVPQGSENERPSARAILASDKQSWAFGAPLNYRVADIEGDPVNVVVQWTNDAGISWNAASSQPDTIAGDSADPTYGLSTALIDDEDISIDPLSPANPGDHMFIWSMKADINRPAPGTQEGPYNMRVIPFGAVRGDAGTTDPVFVLYNTKVVATIIPFEDASGNPDAVQHGDINVVFQLRDIDGDGAQSNGDSATATFEFAVDANEDGQIVESDSEFWLPMTPAGFSVDDGAIPETRNVLEGLQTWSLGPEDPSTMSAYGQRPANRGWGTFVWDSVYDLGAPATQFENVWVRLIPADDDEGITAVVRNVDRDNPDTLIIVKDPDGLWLDQFSAAGGDLSNVALNEPLYFDFNGLVDPDSVTDETLKVMRNGSQIQGVFTVENTSGTTSRVTFFPLAQSSTLGTPTIGEGAADSVLYADRVHQIIIPGYEPMTDPRTGTFLRPANHAFPGDTSTYLLVQNLGIDGTTDSAYQFTARQTYYDDGQGAPSVTLSVPATTDDLGQQSQIALTINQGIDYSTALSPNLTVTADGNVIPGRWSVENTQDPDTGEHVSVLTFTPALHLPSGQTVRVQGASGLLALNGSGLVFVNNYSVLGYGTKTVDIVETFTNEDQKDADVTTALWGSDPCNPGVLTGLQDSSTPPQGGVDLIVKSGEVKDITDQVSDYNDIIVQKGGVLRIRSTAGVATVRAAGEIRIEGVVDFSGEDAASGHHGYMSSSYYMAGSTSRGTRPAPLAFNGAGRGAYSYNGTSSNGRTDGRDGTGPGGTTSYGGGSGGRTAGSTYYYYGAGGGAGGGHATRGEDGGPPVNFTSSSYYFRPSSGGTTYGSRTMTSGVEPGAGGGSGGSHRYSSSYYNQGGSGGSGGGGVTFQCLGAFTVAPSGLVNGRGGTGGSSAHLAGSGGGGSGGGMLVKAGGGAFLDGIIDLRGGRGGPLSVGYYSDYYSMSYTSSRGPSRFGGDGGMGRLVVKAPNMLNTSEVRVFGQLLVRQISSIPTSSLSASAPPSTFANGGSYNFGSTSEVHYTSLNVPSGRTVTLTGTKAVRIFVSGPVTVGGTIRFDGAESAKSSSGFNMGYENYYTGSYNAYPSYVANIKGITGTMGGGAGGDPHGYGSNNKHEAGDAKGPAPGKHEIGSNPGMYGYYQSGDSGGGGGGNASPGDEGWAPYAVSPRYYYAGYLSDTKGTGVEGNNGGQPGAQLDSDNLSVTTLDNFVGSGGGGGNAGGYEYYYFALAGRGGAGAGALAIIGADGETVNISGTISATGGDGVRPGFSYPYYYSHGGGGGGSGGTIYLIGDVISITAPTSETGSGATFDLSGGQGGGWREYRSGAYAYRPAYNTQGHFGGDGGFGRLVIDYKTSVNGGDTLVNRWGHEQTVFHDSSRQYRALAGSFHSECFGPTGGTVAQSDWYDFGSVMPTLTQPTATTVNMSATIQVEGAQSDPHEVGSGTGVVDPDNTTGLMTLSSPYTGSRFWRFYVVFSRATSSSTVPSLDNMTFSDVVTDDPIVD